MIIQFCVARLDDTIRPGDVMAKESQDMIIEGYFYILLDISNHRIDALGNILQYFQASIPYGLY